MRIAMKAAAAVLALATGMGTAASYAQDITVALVPKVAVPFFDDCNTGGAEAANELGVKYQWVVPANTQGSTQVKIIVS